MEQTSRFLLLLSLSATFAKYVYIQEPKHWTEAQDYCRQKHTDLAPVSGEYDMKLLQSLHDHGDMWIGLLRNSTDANKWMWSGGGEVSTFLWEVGQPNDNLNQLEDYGLIKDSKWHDAPDDPSNHFFCYNVSVVTETKTWEEALEHCREKHSDLASVASDTEIMLIRKELAKKTTTALVWIGLRFLAADWLWVDGQPMSYEAWGRGDEPECPDVRKKCGALRVKGGAQSGTRPDGEWEAFDCAQSLHFICY